MRKAPPSSRSRVALASLLAPILIAACALDAPDVDDDPSQPGGKADGATDGSLDSLASRGVSAIETLALRRLATDVEAPFVSRESIELVGDGEFDEWTADVGEFRVDFPEARTYNVRLTGIDDRGKVFFLSSGEPLELFASVADPEAVVAAIQAGGFFKSARRSDIDEVVYLADDDRGETYCGRAFARRHRLQFLDVSVSVVPDAFRNVTFEGRAFEGAALSRHWLETERTFSSARCEQLVRGDVISSGSAPSQTMLEADVREGTTLASRLVGSDISLGEVEAHIDFFAIFDDPNFSNAREPIAAGNARMLLGPGLFDPALAESRRQFGRSARGLLDGAPDQRPRRGVADLKDLAFVYGAFDGPVADYEELKVELARMSRDKEQVTLSFVLAVGHVLNTGYANFEHKIGCTEGLSTALTISISSETSPIVDGLRFTQGVTDRLNTLHLLEHPFRHVTTLQECDAIWRGFAGAR